MKIGLFTYHYALNYGAVLQAFSLEQYLKELGHVPFFINYENDEVVKSYKLFRFKRHMLKKPGKLISRFIRDMFVMRRYRLFREKVNDMISIVGNHEDTPLGLIKQCDAIVIGSDQLWNKIITRGYDYFYCAKYKDNINVPTIGYAISINAKSITEEDKKEINSVVDNFDKLSVRESTSIDLLKPLTDKTITEVLDPTFIVDKNIWEQQVKPVSEKNYICVYAILNAERLIEEAKKIAQKIGKELVIIDPVANWSPYNNYKRLTDPMMFVSYIAQADLVLTSSFHGTAFSIIFNKNFFVLGDDDKNVRMSSFLSSLNLSERIIRFGDCVDYQKAPDYVIVNEMLDVMKAHSREFLSNAIGNNIKKTI